MPQWKGFTEADVLDQSGKCFIVTGANTGLGSRSCPLCIEECFPT